MEAFYIYLIKSSGLIALFYLAYYFMLRKETFFTSNRWFLLLGLLTSVVLPLVVYTKIIMVAPSSKNIDWSRIPVTTSIKNEAFEINWYLIFGIAYGIGIVLFLIKFAFDFYSLNTVLKGKTIQNQADFKFIDTTENVAPFSYFNTIVYNSSLYSSSELENILEHEKVHSEQNHTVDVLISRVFCILFWFNPLIWLYKKAILQNLEFIADSEASKKISDKKAYQFTLLKITTHENCVAITNHFYQSLIKKRIVMLNKNQSNRRNSWKYTLVLPLLAAFMMAFQVNVVTQEKNKKQSGRVDTSQVVICKSSTDDYINESCERIKKEHNIDLKFSEIKRNSKGEILSIEGTFDDNKGTNGNYRQTRDTPINTLKFLIKKSKNGNDEIGFRNADEENTIENENFVSDIDVTTPPTPPTPPNHPYENLMEAPTPPDFPDVPELPSNLNDKKAMEKYEKAMGLYDKKMKIIEPKVKNFEAEMEVYEKEMEKLEPILKNYEKEMEIFDKEMEIFDKEMDIYDKEMAHSDKKLKKQNIVIEKKIIKSKRKQ